MSQIRADHLTFAYDGSPEPVFENASFTLDTDWKLGLIGRNGRGKTTLLRLLAGELSGQGILQKSVPAVYFPYPVTEEMSRRPAAEFAAELRENCELWRVARAAEWADRSERGKIGFDPREEHDRSIGSRSFIGAKTKKMQSRAKSAERRAERELTQQEGLLRDIEKTAVLKMSPLSHHKETLLTVADCALRYKGAAGPVCAGLTFSLRRGERVALRGANGCGKSTLIRAVLQRAGVLPAAAALSVGGICETAPGLVVSYIPQDTSFLRGSVPAFCAERGLDRSLFCAILRQLDLSRAQFERDLSDYSAGQKKKVLLAASLMTPAHLYIWDEPLNFIDLFSRMEIETMLETYRPAMLFAEHDPRFCEKIATETVCL